MSNVTTVYGEAFYNCSSLVSTNLTSCISLSSDAFNSCSKLVSVGLTTAFTRLDGNGQFNGCTLLTNPGDLSNITSTGWNTFYNCASLTSVNFSSALTTIGGRCFSGCTSLTSIGDLSNVITIGSEAFNGCISLESIEFINCVTISESAFNTTKLTSFIVPNTCTSIGNAAFANCSLLSSIVFNEGGTSLSIGSNFLYRDNLITKLTLPAHVTYLSDGFMSWCFNYLTIIINATIPPSLGGSIGGNDNAIIYVPDASVDAYKAATNWSNYASRIKGISEFVE